MAMEIYQHTKTGGIYYLVLGKTLVLTDEMKSLIVEEEDAVAVAKHTETGEFIHIYRWNGGYYTENENLTIYSGSNGMVWARPYEMFFGKVVMNGHLVKRFSRIDEYEN